MTLWALIILCSGNCTEWHDSGRYLVTYTRRDDCETGALQFGMNIVTRIRDGSWDYGDAVYHSDPYPTKAVAPYVEYSTCRQIAFFGGNVLSGE
jgi:hypothetical protein